MSASSVGFSSMFASFVYMYLCMNKKEVFTNAIIDTIYSACACVKFSRETDRVRNLQFLGQT